MESIHYFGVRLITGEVTPPTPDNENLRLLPAWMTPAELMQWVRQEKQRLSRELAMDASLWTCPEHRRTWDATIGIEKLALWQCYGVREG
jgi:hypothetical protein